MKKDFICDDEFQEWNDKIQQQINYVHVVYILYRSYSSLISFINKIKYSPSPKLLTYTINTTQWTDFKWALHIYSVNLVLNSQYISSNYTNVIKYIDTTQIMQIHHQYGPPHPKSYNTLSLIQHDCEVSLKQHLCPTHRIFPHCHIVMNSYNCSHP